MDYTHNLCLVKNKNITIFKFTNFACAKNGYRQTNKHEKFRSFKSKENIHKKEVGPYCRFGC